jgi:hypothetical protein
VLQVLAAKVYIWKDAQEFFKEVGAEGTIVELEQVIADAEPCAYRMLIVIFSLL